MRRPTGSPLPMTDRNVLMIAFHFPPFTGSSGVQRTLRFAQYLREHDWRAQVLTANKRAHEKTSSALDAEIADITVKSAFALDSARHLAIKGRYPGWFAIPDRWITWLLGGIPSGWLMTKKYRPKIIWSTYPIATAHYIGYFLHRLSGLPWVVDFRDPMVEKDIKTGQYTPADGKLRSARLWIENKVAHHANRVVFCTASAKAICEQRYPQADHSRWRVVENGYDERAFEGVERTQAQRTAGHSSSADTKITLLHSGLLYYTADRDPSCFFQALSSLKKKNVVSAERLNVILRASGYEAVYSKMLADLDIEDLVSLEPAIDYQAALTEMLSVDGLLLFQGYTSNPAVPAKAYEYLRAGRPILSLVDDAGETAALMRKLQCDYIAPLDSAAEIETKLMEFLDGIANGTVAVADRSDVSVYSRRSLTKKLAKIFDELVPS